MIHIGVATVILNWDPSVRNLVMVSQMEQALYPTGNQFITTLKMWKYLILSLILRQLGQILRLSTLPSADLTKVNSFYFLQFAQDQMFVHMLFW